MLASITNNLGQKVREIEVLKAARDESNRVLLVYASEHALNFRVEDLPSALRVYQFRRSISMQRLIYLRISSDLTISASTLNWKSQTLPSR